MATLTIRNLPDDVHSALRVRAAKAGRSMEEEARVVLAKSVAGETDEAGSQLEALAKADAAAAALRDALREANNGQLPGGMVESLIAERRAEAARDEAEYAESLANHARWRRS